MLISKVDGQIYIIILEYSVYAWNVAFLVNILPHLQKTKL